MSVFSVSFFRPLLLIVGLATAVGLTACDSQAPQSSEGYQMDSLSRGVYNPGLIQTPQIDSFVHALGAEFDIGFKRVYFSEGKRYLDGMKRFEETWFMHSRAPVCQNADGRAHFAQWSMVRSEFERPEEAVDAFNEFVLLPPPPQKHRFLLLSGTQLWQVKAPGPMRKRMQEALHQWRMEVQATRWPKGKTFVVQWAPVTESEACQGDGLPTYPRFSDEPPLPEDSPALVPRTYNPSLPLTDLELELLPGFRETFDIEKREYWTLWKDGLTCDPGEFQLEYSLSYRKPTYVDDRGGKWYDRWVIKIDRFGNAEQATHAYNRKVAQDLGYARRDYAFKGHESRSLLGGNCIVELSGTCKTANWVHTGYDRLKEIFFPDQTLEKGTVLQTFCGGGAQLMVKP